MDCPRCGIELKPGKLSEAAITYSVRSCSRCNGTWVSAEKLQEIEMDEQAVLVEFRDIPPDPEQLKPLACPECKKTMEKVASDRDDKVVVDVCRSCHKAWLDGGEIEAIRTDSLAANVGRLVKWLAATRKPA
jgi:Zn-finger nucleic acid-binding protein